MRKLERFQDRFLQSRRVENIGKKKKQILAIDGDAQYTQLIYDATACDGAEQDALTSITVHHDSYLVGIAFATRFSTNAANEYCLAELSRSGNFQGQTSDNPDTLAMICCDHSIVTSGGGNMAGNTFIKTKIFFKAGERIYFNQFGTDAVGSQKAAVLYWESFD